MRLGSGIGSSLVTLLNDTTIRVCSSCNNEVMDVADYCHTCGNDLERSWDGQSKDD